MLAEFASDVVDEAGIDPKLSTDACIAQARTAFL